MDNPALWISLAQFLLYFAGALIGGTWAVTRANGKLYREVNKKIEESVKDFGETIAALKEHLNKAQFWNRDNLVDKETFRSLVEDVKEINRRLNDLGRLPGQD